jgi:hypothetical protein
VKRARVLAGFGLAAIVAGGAYVQIADAQRVDPRRPATLVVGAPGGASPMQRVDARRSGMSKQALPSGRLTVAWRKTIGLSIDQAALAGSDGTLAVVTTRGDVVFLDDAGEERGHVSVGAGSVGPAVMTSDGTIVFTTSSGEAVGVKRGSGPNPATKPRFTTRIGGDRNGRAAPLALDDGGVVVASSTDLVVLDAEGNVRARTALPETIAAPLLASGDKVLAVGARGAVFGWTPGREPSRLGSFGAPIDGVAALADATTLLAVIETNHLVELDIGRGVRSTRAIAAQGLYLGPPSVRPGQGGTSIATLLAMIPSRGFVVSVDGAGQEILRAPIETRSPHVLPDGGAAPLVAPAHVGPLVDARGTIAFGAMDGHVGIITSEGVVETIADQVCSRGGSKTAGLTPFGRASFAVTCLDGGVVVRVVGPDAESTAKKPSGSGPTLRPSSSAARPTPSPSAAPDDDDDDDSP